MKTEIKNKQQVSVLNEQKIKVLLSENIKWKTEEAWWSRSSERFANAPFGYYLEIFSIPGNINGEFKAIIYASILNKDNEITIQTQPLFEFKFHESAISYAPAENKEPCSCVNVKCSSCDISAEPTMAYGGSELVRTVTCTECGTSWKEFFIFDRWELE